MSEGSDKNVRSIIFFGCHCPSINLRVKLTRAEVWLLVFSSLISQFGYKRQLTRISRPLCEVDFCNVPAGLKVLRFVECRCPELRRGDRNLPSACKIEWETKIHTQV